MSRNLRDLRVMIDIDEQLVSSALLLVGGVHIGARALLDVVWLYRSPIPVGSRRLFYLFKRFLPAFAARAGGTGGGGGFSILWLQWNWIHGNSVLYIDSSVPGQLGSVRSVA